MVTIDFLKNHPEAVPKLSEIWQEVLGNIWLPGTPLDSIIQRFQKHLNDDFLPLTYLALCEGQPVGMCSLREKECFPSDLSPWLGSLVVEPAYQKRGIGKLLIDTVKAKASSFGFQKIYLSAFDLKVVDYYRRLGWKQIGNIEFNGNFITLMETTV